MFLAPRHRKLMGLPESDEPPKPSANRPPRCCPKATADVCYCQALGWLCPDHGITANPCRPGFTHD